MSKVTRRAMARYGADQLLAGKSAGEVAKYLASALIENGMARETELLAGDIAWELEQRKELSVAKVTSARPLTAELVDQLKAQIAKATGSHEVILDQEIDKSVLGGMRVETAGKVWDSTLSRKLTDLREAF